MGINFDKQFYLVENNFDDVADLHIKLCSKVSNYNREQLLKKVSDLQHAISNYKASLKNIYIRDDKFGKNQ